MPGAHRNQKKASDPLELELQTAMSCHVGAQNLTSAFKLMNHFSSSMQIFVHFFGFWFGFGFVWLFVCLFEPGYHYVVLAGLNSLCRPRWPRDPPTSASRMLDLNAYATTIQMLDYPQPGKNLFT